MATSFGMCVLSKVADPQCNHAVSASTRSPPAVKGSVTSGAIGLLHPHQRNRGHRLLRGRGSPMRKLLHKVCNQLRPCTVPEDALMCAGVGGAGPEAELPLPWMITGSPYRPSARKREGQDRYPHLRILLCEIYSNLNLSF